MNLRCGDWRLRYIYTFTDSDLLLAGVREVTKHICWGGKTFPIHWSTIVYNWHGHQGILHLCLYGCHGNGPEWDQSGRRVPYPNSSQHCSRSMRNLPHNSEGLLQTCNRIFIFSLAPLSVVRIFCSDTLGLRVTAVMFLTDSREVWLNVRLLYTEQ